MENGLYNYTVFMVVSYICGVIIEGDILFQENPLYQMNSKNIVNSHILFVETENSDITSLSSEFLTYICCNSHVLFHYNLMPLIDSTEI